MATHNCIGAPCWLCFPPADSQQPLRKCPTCAGGCIYDKDFTTELNQKLWDNDNSDTITRRAMDQALRGPVRRWEDYQP